jgi:hypothetical protein
VHADVGDGAAGRDDLRWTQINKSFHDAGFSAVNRAQAAGARPQASRGGGIAFVRAWATASEITLFRVSIIFDPTKLESGCRYFVTGAMNTLGHLNNECPGATAGDQVVRLSSMKVGNCAGRLADDQYTQTPDKVDYDLSAVSLGRSFAFKGDRS